MHTQTAGGLAQPVCVRVCEGECEGLSGGGGVHCPHESMDSVHLHAFFMHYVILCQH